MSGIDCVTVDGVDHVVSLDSALMDCPKCDTQLESEEDLDNENRAVFYCYGCDALIREVKFVSPAELKKLQEAAN